MLTLQTPPILSWQPTLQTPHVFSPWQFPAFSLPPLRNPTDLNLFSLVPLPREPEPLQKSSQMRIYNGSNPKKFIEESEDDIMKGFTKFLEKNPDKISELSTSNIIISYNISPQNELSLSFDFEASNRQNQDSITFINAENETHIITKNNDIKKLEETPPSKIVSET
jgi:hypothetical protein